jgi:photosystem II PsbU protein
MKRLGHILGLLVLVVSCLGWFGVPQAQALTITALNLPSSPILAAKTRVNAVDALLSTEFGKKIDLNNSDIRDFRDLRGFYPNLAGKIIKNAPYQSVDDVLNIPGLTESQKERLQANLGNFTVTEPAKEFNEGDDRINPGVY